MDNIKINTIDIISKMNKIGHFKYDRFEFDFINAETFTDNAIKLDFEINVERSPLMHFQFRNSHLSNNPLPFELMEGSDIQSYKFKINFELVFKMHILSINMFHHIALNEDDNTSKMMNILSIIAYPTDGLSDLHRHRKSKKRIDYNKIFVRHYSSGVKLNEDDNVHIELIHDHDYINDICERTSVYKFNIESDSLSFEWCLKTLSKIMGDEFNDFMSIVGMVGMTNADNTSVLKDMLFVNECTKFDMLVPKSYNDDETNQLFYYSAIVARFLHATLIRNGVVCPFLNEIVITKHYKNEYNVILLPSGNIVSTLCKFDSYEQKTDDVRFVGGHYDKKSERLEFVGDVTCREDESLSDICEKSTFIKFAMFSILATRSFPPSSYESLSSASMHNMPHNTDAQIVQFPLSFREMYVPYCIMHYTNNPSDYIVENIIGNPKKMKNVDAYIEPKYLLSMKVQKISILETQCGLVKSADKEFTFIACSGGEIKCGNDRNDTVYYRVYKSVINMHYVCQFSDNVDFENMNVVAAINAINPKIIKCVKRSMSSYTELIEMTTDQRHSYIASDEYRSLMKAFLSQLSVYSTILYSLFYVH